MADSKISDLTAATVLVGTDEFVIASSGTTKKITASDMSLAFGASNDGWVVAGETWTYASATTFTVPGNLTVEYSKGTRIKLTQTTDKYFVVSASSHAAGTTTVTITGGADYTLANAAITSPYYSYAANPQGYPAHFTYQTTWGGFSSAPTGDEYFSVIGTVCTVLISPTGAGTSNATNLTFTLPIAAFWYPLTAIRAYNNGAFGTSPGFATGSDGSATVDCYRDWGSTAWTGSGAKMIQTIFSYLI